MSSYNINLDTETHDLGIVDDLGAYINAIDAAKAYQTYVILNRLEHSYIPVLSDDEIKNILSNVEVSDAV